MNFATEREFEDWFYHNLFDGPLCVLVEGQKYTIGVQEDNDEF